MTGWRAPLPSDEEFRAYNEPGPGDTILEKLSENARRIAELHAEQTRLLAEFATHRPSTRGRRFSEFAADEISATLSWTRHTAHLRLDRAITMTQHLPQVLTALQTGVLDAWRADAIVDATAKLPTDVAVRVADHVLTRAEGRTISDLRRVIRRAILKHDPAGATRRHTDARAARRVEFTPCDDGMASLWAYLPANEATTIHRRLDAFAREKTPDDTRSHDQRRADALIDLTLNPAHGPIITTVHLTMPTTAVTPNPIPLNDLNAPNTASETAELTGYGTITTEAARHLALGLLTTGNDRHSDELVARPTTETQLDPSTNQIPTTTPHGHTPTVTAAPNTAATEPPPTAQQPKPPTQAEPNPLLGNNPNGYAHKVLTDPRWRRLLTDPATGAAVELSNRTYKPTTALADYVRARDQHCVFPGCLHPAASCDIDHRTPYPQGDTSADNLNCLCRHHHRLKQQPGWTLTRQNDHYIWTNPGGILYITTPDPLQDPEPTPLPATNPTPNDDPPPF